MAFHESPRFPELWAVSSRGGPGFSTSIVEGDTGGSERVSRWPNARRRYNIKPGNKSQDALAQLLDFYIARQGPAIGFRFKDFLDFTTATNHRAAPAATNVFLGTATGGSGTFQLRTQYVSGSTTIFRTIEKPVAGTVLIAANGSTVSAGNYSVNTTTGLVNITGGISIGQSITGGCEFDVPVQFAPEVDEQFQASIENYEWGDINEIPLIEMLGNVSSPERFYYGGGTTLATAANFTIDFAKGRVIVYTGSGSVTAFAPDPADLELGGPYFMLYHGGSGTITVKTYDNASTIGTLSTVGKFGMLVVYSDAGINKWALLAT